MSTESARLALTDGFCQVVRVENGDVLRRLRYTFELNDQAVINLFEHGGLTVNRELISNLLKKDDDPSYEACSNVQLAAFLNGLIREKRGTREGESGPPPLESSLNNNDILRKLKIALSLRQEDLLELMALAGMPLGRAEISALFRKPNHAHYRQCQDQLLRNFLQGLQLKLRATPVTKSEPTVPSSLATESFDSLPGFLWTPEFRKQFERDGITAPTSPQSLAFEAIVFGKHVLIDSGTGTGKTLAYVLPLLLHLEQNPAARVVCLAPAAELAIQTLNVINRYKTPDLAVGALVGGGNQNKQKDRIQKSTRLIVGTPGRVLESIGARKLKGITTFVLDEPEPILNSKDAAFLLEVFSRPPRPQLIVAGATFGRASKALVEQFMSERLIHAQSESSPLTSQITHHRLRVRDAGDRDLQLLRFLEQENQDRSIVYVNQAHLIRHLFRFLMDAEIPTVSLSEERTKQQCKEALLTFSQGEAQVLLTTDRAATGIDLKGVPWVVHYEPPRSPQAYVHRAGRTGRAKMSGRSLCLIADSERFILKGLEKELGIAFGDFRV